MFLDEKIIGLSILATAKGGEKRRKEKVGRREGQGGWGRQGHASPGKVVEGVLKMGSVLFNLKLSVLISFKLYRKVKFQ